MGMLPSNEFWASVLEQRRNRVRYRMWGRTWYEVEMALQRSSCVRLERNPSSVGRTPVIEFSPEQEERDECPIFLTHA